MVGFRRDKLGKRGEKVGTEKEMIMMITTNQKKNEEPE
jgi:hypothetical protein